VPLSNPDYPFGVGKPIKRTASGLFIYQWLGNTKENVRGTYRLCWLDDRDNKHMYIDKPPGEHRARSPDLCQYRRT
jgi:hypothetical protein